MTADRVAAERVMVVTDEGTRYPGWVVLPDVVLVRGLRRVDFCPSVRVERGGQVFAVRELVDSVKATPPRRKGVVLILADGSIPVAGGTAAPPDVTASEEDWRDHFGRS